MAKKENQEVVVEDPDKLYKDADKANKENKYKDLKEVQDAKKDGKLEAQFVPMTDDDNKAVDKILNDRKQNIIQALKSHYQLVFAYKQGQSFQQRFDKAVIAVEAGTQEIKDNYGLPMSVEELKFEAIKNTIDLRFMRSQIANNIEDFNKTWGIDETKVDEYFKKWIVGNEDISL